MSDGITIRNLSWSFGENRVLKDLCIDIPSGQFTGIIGPNGSGKTTLLRNISASLRPERNRVLLGQEDVLTLTPRELALRMAYVPQNTHIAFDFSVEDIVLMGRNPHLGRFQQEGEEDIEIARQAMELTGTLPFKDRKITELSGGERQRVLIARALAQQSNIILLDEPTSNLDIKHQVEILQMVKSLVKTKSLTVVCVLHDLNLAAHFCETIVLLHHGQVFRQGKVEEVLQPDVIEEVYGLPVTMMQDPATGAPYILPNFKQVS